MTVNEQWTSVSTLHYTEQSLSSYSTRAAAATITTTTVTTGTTTLPPPSPFLLFLPLLPLLPRLHLHFVTFVTICVKMIQRSSSKNQIVLKVLLQYSDYLYHFLLDFSLSVHLSLPGYNFGI